MLSFVQEVTRRWLALGALFVSSFLVCCEAPALPCPVPEVQLENIFITEIFRGSKKGEGWFELFNQSQKPIDLSGLAVSKRALDGTGFDRAIVYERLIVPGRGYLQINGDQLASAFSDGWSPDDGGQVWLDRCGERLDSVTYWSLPKNHALHLSSDAEAFKTVSERSVYSPSGRSTAAPLEPKEEVSWCITEKPTPQKRNHQCPDM